VGVLKKIRIFNKARRNHLEVSSSRNGVNKSNLRLYAFKNQENPFFGLS